MKKTITVEVRREHLERARLAAHEISHQKARGHWCMLSQSLRDVGISGYCTRTCILDDRGKFSVQLPGVAQTLVSLFDDHQDDRIKALLPVHFDVEVEAAS